MNLLLAMMQRVTRFVRRIGITSLVLLFASLFAAVGHVHAEAVCNAPGAITGLPLNSYYPGVGTANAGSRTVTVGTPRAADGNTSGAEAIVAGDTVFIIQVQGADIDNSDSNSYGDGTIGGGKGYTNLNSAGLYEFATVESVAGSTLTLVDQLNHSYASAGATTSTTRRTFQVVKVPRFYNFNLDTGGTVTPWNGRTGGIYVLDVVNELTVDAGVTIDASEAGFRGGGAIDIDPFTSGANVTTFATLMDGGPNIGVNELAAAKGEGIAGTPNFVSGGVAPLTGQSANLTSAAQGFPGDLGYPNGLTAGRGGAGNAGGGGAEHNAGGAGGSNYGFGGNGGASFAFYFTSDQGTCTQYDTNFFACDGDGSRPVGGVEGEVLTKPTITDYQSRLFMGGGAGAGATNNSDDANGTAPPGDDVVNIAQSSGGAGGGIIVIRTNNLTDGGGNLTLRSNGGDGLPAGRDGAGGGGAGGSVLLLATGGSYNFIDIEASGGAGGITGYNPTPATNGLEDGETQGPGGGGGGGAALIASSVNISSIVTAGGIPGVNRPDENQPTLLNPLQAGTGQGSSVKVPYDPLTIDAAGACGEDFGDASGYADATHVLIRQIFMGNLPDGEANTLSDDNSFERVDEDGLISLPSLTDTDGSYSVDVQVSNTTGLGGTLFGWIDFDGNGTFDAAEGTSVAVADGANGATATLTWASTPGITAGNTQLRLRITTDTSVTTATASGFAEDGEVEDHPLTILAGGAVCSYPTADGIWQFNGSVVDTGPNAFTPAVNPLTAADFSSAVYASAPSAPLFNGDAVVLDDNNNGNTTFLNEAFNEMSLIFWLKPESFTGTQMIWDEGGGTNGVAIQLNGTTLEARARDNNNNIDLSVPWPQDNRWHHVGIVYDNTDFELYLDGTLVDSDTSGGGHVLPLNAHTSAPELGSGNGTSFGANGNDYNGYLDELVYWVDAASGGNAGNAVQSANMAALAACHTPVILEDYGDAPDTGAGTSTNNYETLDANDGPRHMLGASLYLGDVAPDDDIDADQNADATGDDSNDGALIGNDEGEAQLLSTATTLAPVITTDTSYQIEIDVTNNEAAAANLYAWIDFDRSGTFDDSELATGAAISVANTGSNTATITWSGLSGLTAGTTFMRLRLTTDALVDGLGTEDGRSRGYASNGEVEDYQISITPPPDFGDAPSVFGDAWHNISGSNTLFLGLIAGDGETATQDGGDGGAGADGDDGNATDDEDGLDAGIPDLNINDTTYTLPVTVTNTGAAGRLVAWLDFDQSNSFENDEFATVAVSSSGTVNLVWNNIGSSGPDISLGDAVLRLRLSRDTSVANTTAAVSSSTGAATDGEVEDHIITILGSDFGDAPATFGDASHELATNPALYLGTGAPDQELTTQLAADAGAGADGDDGDGNDDENGVVSFAGINDTSTGTYNVDVDVINTGASANLRGWIDFNLDNVFDASEASNLITVASSGSYTLAFTIPGGLVPGSSYARFRVSTDAIGAGAFNDASAGAALSDGEVEDYPFTIADSNSYFFEAECGLIGPNWGVFNDPVVSSNTYVATITGGIGETPRAGSQSSFDYIRYDFNLPATGTFDIFALVNFPDSGSNSFSTSTDDNNWPLFNNGGFNTSSFWDWRLVNNTITGNSGDPISLYMAYQEAGALIDKFAIVSTGSSAPTGLGEATASCFDFADAPDTSPGNSTEDYNSLILRNGPYHINLNGATFIGAVAADNETEALTNLDASGDGADELPADLSAGGLPSVSVGATSYSFDADYSHGGPLTARLFAWIDSDRDGIFEDSELADGSPYGLTGSGTQTVTWSTLPALSQNNYYIRLRFTGDLGLPAANGGEDERSLGPAIDGEVEDHILVPIATDFGDVPITSAGDYDDTNNDGTVTVADNAANHTVSSNLFLGAAVADNDTGMWGDGTDTNGDATDDDTEGTVPDDEDSTTFVSFAENATSYSASTSVSNSSGSTANLFAWIDFDGNGSFDEDERAVITGGVSSGGQIPNGASGVVSLDWSSLPADTIFGATYARLRITTDNLDTTADGSSTDDASLGSATNGEIEDYQVIISSARDFGDAPSSYGDAAHLVSVNLHLGSNQGDIDPNTQLGGDAGAGADGDDGDGNNDEDGVASFDPLNNGLTSYQATITVNNSTGGVANLYAWIDFDGSGEFDEDERATVQDGTVTGTGTNTIPVGANGTVILNWASAPGIAVGTTYVRVRTTTATIDNTADGATQDDASIGAAIDGEVEDYEVIISDASEVFFEAECGITGNVWTAGSDTTASETVFLNGTVDDFVCDTSQQPINTLVRYDVQVPIAGTYDIYVRLRTGAFGANPLNPGFSWGFDNDADGIPWPTYSDGTTFANFTWLNLATLNTSGLVFCDAYAPLVTTTANETVTFYIGNLRGTSQIDKFAFLPAGSPVPTGTGDNVASCFDYGDAPDTALNTNAVGDYTSLLGNTVPGPYHATDASPAVFLGNTAPDIENDALQTTNADGDDAPDEGEAQLISTSGGDAFPVLTAASSSYSIDIDATNNKAVDALVLAWIDFDRNGTFDEDERTNATIGAASGSTQQTLTWTGLSGLSSGDVYARFRITTDTQFTVGGTGATEDSESLDVVIDGETEDHVLTIVDIDFGDAPVNNAGDYDDTDGSGTVDGSDDPASHLIAGNVSFGAAPDGDSGVWGDGTDATSGATGRAADDDNEGSTPDDEDAVTITALTTVDTSYSLTANVNNGDASNPARVLAWIDFDQNGRFDEDERATLSAGTVTPSGLTIPASASGTLVLNWSSLPGITSGATYLRLRISSDTSWNEGSLGSDSEDSASTGVVTNGEVEDHEIIVAGVDFGDAPIVANGYYDDTNGDGSVNSSDNPARHLVVAGTRLGANDPDGESNTFGDGTDDTNNATDDDSEGSTPDDEDAFASFPVLLTNATSYTLSPSATNGDAVNAATVAAWIDFDGNGAFDEDERATATVAVSTTATPTLTWSTIPADIVDGTTYLRIRVSSDPAFSPTGSAANTEDSSALGLFNNGEVEDYQFTISGLDYGDAPIVSAGGFDDTDGSGIADVADDPAAHGITTALRLGNNVADADTERYGDGTDTNGNATDDDTINDPAGGYDDENGVVSLLPIPSAATSYSLDISVTNTTGSTANLLAWIDFDNDGLWEESERQTTTVATGTNNVDQTLTWTGLSGLSLGNVYLRVRLATANLDVATQGANVQDDAATGTTTDGEVEDYQLSIVASEDYGDVPIAAAGDFDDGNAARHGVDANLYIGANVPDIDSGQWADGTDANGNATDDDLEGATPDDEDGVTITNILTSDIGSNYNLTLDTFNNTGSDANVYAWIDFDQSKTFDEDEVATATVTSTGAADTASLSWLIPSDLAAGTTYVRIRITNDNLAAVGGGEDERSAGLASNGEVEDFSVLVQATDFGDAPDSFGTLAPTGASHIIASNIYLGSTAADQDNNGFVDGTDDSAGLATDDEVGGDEGIAQLLNSGSSFPELNDTDTSYSIVVNAFNNAGSAAQILAWIDFDGSGSFDEDEIATVGVPSNASLQVRTINWTSTPGISSGATYMRLRITTDSPSGNGSGADERAVGQLSNGEVEDYVITVGNLDFGDAPSPYKTLLADDGARHLIDPSLFLGSVAPDLDTDGFSEGTDTNGNATDDEADGSDEAPADLATFANLFTSNSSYTVNATYNNTTGSAARIYAWIDFDQNGTFDVDEATEGLFGTGTSQVAALTWSSIPNDIAGGTTYLRVRITSSPLTAPASGEDTRSFGVLPNGEVEDHQLTVIPVDFGDAPSSYGTFLANSGPRHEVSTDLFLGSTVADGDSNGFANGVVDTGNALDDDNEGSADEGITQLLGVASFPVLDDADNSYSLTVNVTNSTAATANLYAWIDFDNSGTFELDELAQTTVNNVGATTGTLNWAGIAADSVVSVTYARFRLRSDANTSPLGSAPDGEVEDYRFEISGATNISGVVFEDINYGGGNGRNYAVANGSFTATDVATPATVELWSYNGSTCDSLLNTINTPDGNYNFTNVAAPGDYCVRVSTSTVESNRTGYVASLVPVQTYRAESTDGIGSVTVVGDEIGGRFPALVDTATGIFSDSQTHSWSRVVTNGAAVNNIDFGYSFHTIVNTNDADQGSLRQFILNANALDNAAIAQQTQTSLIDVSIFEIPTTDANYNLAGEEVFRITPLTALPTVTDAVELNASTQDAAVCPKPKVEVTGTSTAGSGFDITAGASTVRGFVLNNWSVAGISLSSGNGNQIDCNYIGTTSAGNAAAANAVGVVVNSNQNVIGGTNSARPNVISGNTGVAVNVTADQNQVFRNVIGLGADGLSRLDNGAHGVLINGVSNEVGTTSSTARNSIAYNNGDAVRVIGGNSSVQNEIRINEIYNNAGLGLDLSGDGITGIDVGDGDSGENNLLNRPYNMGVVVAGNDLQISRDIDVPVGVYTLEYYANPVCNADQNGVAQVAAPAGESFQFIGSVSVIISAAGVNAAVDTLSGIVPTLLGGSITAKLVEDGGDTSEFSDCVTAVAPQVISGTVFEDVNYGGGAGRNLATSSGVGVPATVELWASDGVNCTGGAPIQAVSSSAVDGSYSFTTAQPGAEYCVRVVNSTVQSSRGGWTNGITPVQTYRTDYDDDGAGFSAVTDHVGGESPRDIDSVAGVIDIAANDGVRTQSIALIDLPVAGDVANIDFGYNFSTIVNVNTSGQGSFAQFVQNASTLGGQASLAQSGSRVPLAGSGTEALPAGVESSIFMISNGGATAGLTSSYPNLLNGAGIAEISLASDVVINTDNISLDATTQSQNVFGNNGIFFNGSATVGRNAVSQNPTMQLEVQLSGGAIDLAANNLQLRGFALLPTNTAVTVNSGSGHIIEHNAFGTSGLNFTEPGSGSASDLLIVNGPDNGFIRQNHFGFGDQRGLLFGNGSTGWTIDDNVFQGFAVSGMETVAQFSCTSAARNQFNANGIGLNVLGGASASSCSFTDFNANQNQAEGVRVNLGSASSITLQDGEITQNQADGVAVNNDSDNILITQSHIFNNGDLGIDLGSDSVTANDGTDGDSGPNELMNYPVISSVTANGATATINGTLTSNQATPLSVELYSSTVCNGDTSGVAQTPVFGEGEKYHSTTAVTSGAAFNINVNTAELAGPFISLLARDNNGNTSEFSACVNSTFDDYGDAPDTYGTTNANNGARHRTTSTLFLGASAPDAEVNGFVDGIDNSATASDDDNDDGNDDEDIGATVPTLTSALRNYTITVNNYSNTTGSDAQLTAWIDFDRNGTFDTDEAASVTIGSGSSGAVDLEWVETPAGGQGSIPLDIAEGASFIRYRLTTEAAVLTGDPTTSSPIGAAQDGEVEDHPITINPGLDFGDAPDSYSTLLASNGPRHTRNLQLYLGSIAPDGEFDGVPATTGADADGDDLNGINDDEDSADIPGITPGSTSYTATVDVINTTGDDITIHGWFDWNRNGAFDTAEYTSTALTGSTGSITDVALNWTGISLGAITGAEQSYIRIRLARTSEGITSSDVGGFFGDGEVEDYRITISELTCNTLYTQNFQTSVNNGLGATMHIYDPSQGAFADNLTDVFETEDPLSNDIESNGVALDPITRRYYYYDDEGDNSLFYNDGSGPVDTGVNITPTDNYNRAAFNPDGELFFIDSNLAGGTNGIKSFDVVGTGLTPVITNATIVNHPDNAAQGFNITATVGGDIAFDLDGNLYLLSYNGTNPTEFYVSRILAAQLANANPQAELLVSAPAPVSVPADERRQTAGAAFFTDDLLYMFTVGGPVFSWNISVTGAPINTLTNREMRQGGQVFGSPDAASCIFPLLRPALIVEKEVFNVTEPSSAGFVPGQRLRYRITVENVGVNFSEDTVFTDTIPANSTYVLGSTTLNGVSVPDSGVQMPYVTGAEINSPSGSSGRVESGETAVIEFQVNTDVATGYTEVCNENGIITFDDIGAQSPTGGETLTQGTDNPSTSDSPIFPAVGGVTSDPTCIQKISGFAITGTVYDDINVDGVNDGSGAGENGISGVEIVLRDDTAGTCTSTQTDASGGYSFGPVTGGSYTVYEADGELTPVPANCPPVENDPTGYVSTTVNSLNVNVTNADIDDIDFGDVREPLYSPNNSGIVQPGNSLVYAHIFSPRSDGTVSFSFTETPVPLIAGWSVTLYLDNDCDSMLSGADSLITGSVAATANTDICMLARVTAPSSANAGNTHTLDISADFDYPGSFVPNTSLQVTDTTTVVSADDGSLLLIKTVENMTATSPYFDNGVQQVSNEGEPGDELLYRVTFQNVGSTPVTNIDIFDTTPAFTALNVAISNNCVDARETAVVPQIPAGLSCTVILPAAVDNVVGYTGSIQWQLTGTLAAGEAGVVLFSVTID